MTALKTPSLPSFVSSFTPQGSTYTWPDGVTCWYSSASMTFAISFTDTLPHNVTLFAKDDDSTGRVETIQVGSTSQQIANFHAGTYLTYTVTGNVTFKITVNGGANAVVTSFFFDPAPGVTPPVCPASKVTLYWGAVVGATGYNVYQNGVKLTSAPIPGLSYTIGGLTSGTYSFQITSVNAQGESPLSSSMSVTVP